MLSVESTHKPFHRWYQVESGVVGIPCLCPTLTGHDHVPILQPDARVPSRSKIAITAVAGESFERQRKREPVSLGDASGESHVLSGPLVLAVDRRRSSEGVQSFDSLFRDGHETTFARFALGSSVLVHSSVRYRYVPACGSRGWNGTLSPLCAIPVKTAIFRPSSESHTRIIEQEYSGS